jgi:hypothetical protein
MVLQECLVHLVLSDKLVLKVFKACKVSQVPRAHLAHLVHLDLPVLRVPLVQVAVEHWDTQVEQLD